MAAVNSVQGGLRLPLAGLAPPRVLMCSASMGAEGSVTLQLREAVQAPESGASLDAALTIGYPDPELLADMLGTLQAAGATESSTYNIMESKDSQSPSLIKSSSSQQSMKEKDSVSKMNSSTVNNNNSSSNNNNISNINNNNNSNSNTNNSNYNESPSPAMPVTTTTTIANPTKNVQSNTTNTTIVKKPRPKTASPTRHGPQQCQVCNKIFGNASALAKHKLTHSDERKYVCVMCSKAFKRQDHLNGHMLTHRNKKPYECKAEGCGKSYCDARSLRRHTENHHSTLATAPSTPNQILTSTGPPTGLSLSPATANGDASSPHGATLIQYPNVDGSNSKSPSPSSPAGAGNEGLTRQQLDLISQIMQQTKQANANLTAAAGQRPPQRPRTWNMQTQLQQNQTKLLTNSDSPNNLTPNAQNIKNNIEQKPVECNLCHRKFKNIPALNGHMRLHGGYFKKDSETKKCDKKETPGPPLQTASVGVRALIEEKIINKRSKDLKGAFVVPAPPLAARRISDNENFRTPNTSLSSQIQNVITTSHSGVTVSMSQPATTVATAVQVGGNFQKSTVNGLSNATEGKDATLIELLKRGTKVAVKRTCSDPGQLTNSTLQNTTVVLPPRGSISTPATPTSTPPLALSLTGNDSTPLALTISQTPSGNGDVFTLAYSTDNSAFFSENDVYGVPDTAMLLQAVDTIQLLHDTSPSDQLDDIASLSDYTLTDPGSLTDGVTLSQSFTPSRQLQAVLNSPLPESLAEFSTLHSKDYVLYGCTSSDSPATQSSNSPLPSPLAYPTPPASHEAVAQASPFLDESHHFSDASSFFDDKRNNFMDENSAQSFFKESTNKSNTEMTDNEKILKLKNELFNESKSVLLEGSSFYTNQKSLLSDNSSIFNTKMDQLSNGGSPLQINSSNFAHQNLSFLDEPQNFLDDGRNTSSPLSAAFFTATMSSAEEVKEALEEVLPNENLHDNTDDNDIDLYYLPSLSLQSQMMPNSDDPLLSSSPKDFTHHKTQKFDFTIFSPPSAKKIKLTTNSNNNNINTNNNNNITNNNNNYNNNCNNNSININSNNNINHNDNEQIHKIIYNNINNNGANNKIPLTIHTTEQQIIPKDSEIFLSPNSITSSSTPSPKIIYNQTHIHLQQSNHQFIKKKHPNDKFKQNIKFKSFLRKFPSGTNNHYTPLPILDPQRNASGLFMNFNSKSEYFNEIKEISDIDFYSSKPAINIGVEFQAILPNCSTSYNHYNHSCDVQTWDPKVVKDEKALQRYLDLAKSSAVPLGSHSEETALKTLLEAQGEIHIAILGLLQSPSTACHQRWSPQEMDIFLHGLEMYGKDFYKISQEVVQKTTADCIQLYYFWKKLCLNYKITHLKQCTHHNQQDTLNNNLNIFDVCTSIIDTENEICSYNQSHINPLHNSQISDVRPHVCEMPDCSASFTSKAALHGHTRLHCIGRGINNSFSNGLTTHTNNGNLVSKDDYPCKVCGKIFNKVKSRSAHMKSHRPQESEITSN